MNEYENLVLEGGGSKVIIYVGALKAMDEKGVLKNFKRFAGTSAGALVATLLALDYSVQEIYNAVKKLLAAIRNLGDGNFGSSLGLYDIYKLYTQYGINPSDTIEEVIKEVIGKKYQPDITLQEAYKITRKKLVIVTCNANRRRPVYLRASLFPDVKIVDALVATISIPIFFIPRQYDFLETMDYYIDGGTVDNYPIWIFNDLEKLDSANYLDLYKVDKEDISPKTLGLKILEPKEKNNKSIVSNRIEISGTAGFIMSIVNSMMYQIEREIISDSYIKQTIGLRVPKMNFTDFNLSSEEITKLINRGTEQFLAYYEVNK